MDAMTLTEAKADIEGLMDVAVESGEPVVVTRDGKPPVVVMSLDAWNCWQTTIALMRDPEGYARLKRSIAEAERGDLVEVAADQLTDHASAGAVPRAAE